jgi:hypothetical protein
LSPPPQPRLTAAARNPAARPVRVVKLMVSSSPFWLAGAGMAPERGDSIRHAIFRNEPPVTPVYEPPLTPISPVRVV